MPWVSPPLRDHRESPTLVVLVSALQLGLVVGVWLLALVPAAVVALSIMGFRVVRRPWGRSPPPTPDDQRR